MERQEFIRQQRVSLTERIAIEMIAQRDSIRLCEAVRYLLREGARSIGIWKNAQEAANEEQPVHFKYGMKKGYQYASVICPDCGKAVAANWIVRHRKENCEIG